MPPIKRGALIYYNHYFVYVIPYFLLFNIFDALDVGINSCHC